MEEGCVLGGVGVFSGEWVCSRGRGCVLAGQLPLVVIIKIIDDRIYFMGIVNWYTYKYSVSF